MEMNLRALCPPCGDMHVQGPSGVSLALFISHHRLASNSSVVAAVSLGCT